jgi:hypothetical protein
MIWRRRPALAGPRRRRRGIGCLPLVSIVAAALVLALVVAMQPRTMPDGEPIAVLEPKTELTHLRSPASFSSIASPKARSAALFQKRAA